MKKIMALFQKCRLKKFHTRIHPSIVGTEGQKIWDDRYGSMKQSLRLWQCAFFTSLVTIAVLGGLLGYSAMTSKVQPFIVETHEGMPYAIAPMQHISPHDQRLMNFVLNQFITHARTVVHDREAQKGLLDKVYAYSANQTLSFLHDYYQKKNPFETAAEVTTMVNIISTLPMSQESWQITWDETERNAMDGSIIKTTRWVAHLTIQLGEVNPHFILHNPFGLYITQLYWTPTLGGESA